MYLFVPYTSETKLDVYFPRILNAEPSYKLSGTSAKRRNKCVPTYIIIRYV